MSAASLRSRPPQIGGLLRHARFRQFLDVVHDAVELPLSVDLLAPAQNRKTGDLAKTTGTLMVVVFALMPDRQNGDGFIAIDFVQGDVTACAKRNHDLANEGIARSRLAKAEWR